MTLPIGIISSSGSSGGIVGYDPDTIAWITTAGAGNVSTPRRALVDAFIVGAKADGFWTALDVLWVWAAENEASALVDWKSRLTATKIGAPAFTTDRGYTGGTGKALTSAYNYGSTGPNQSYTSGAFGGYVNQDDLGTGAIQGQQAGWWGDYVFHCRDTGYYVRFSGASALTAANADNLGFHVSTRNGNAVDVYRNGVSAGSGTITANSRDNGSPAYFVGNGADPTGCRLAMNFVGGYLSPTDVANLNSRLVTFLTALGAN